MWKHCPDTKGIKTTEHSCRDYPHYGENTAL